MNGLQKYPVATEMGAKMIGAVGQSLLAPDSSQQADDQYNLWLRKAQMTNSASPTGSAATRQPQMGVIAPSIQTGNALNTGLAGAGGYTVNNQGMLVKT
jgi:hypothetical protein